MHGNADGALHGANVGLFASGITRGLLSLRRGSGTRALRRGSAPSDALAGSIRTVNPNYPQVGFTVNCVNCVIATEKRFAGMVGVTAGASRVPLPISRITAEFGGQFENVSGMMDIARRLSASGNGARGIVYGADTARGYGHVWNVRIDNGVVRFLDSQPAGRAGLGVNNFNSFTDFKFLLTHPGKVVP